MFTMQRHYLDQTLVPWRGNLLQVASNSERLYRDSEGTTPRTPESCSLHGHFDCQFVNISHNSVQEVIILYSSIYNDQEVEWIYWLLEESCPDIQYRGLHCQSHWLQQCMQIESNSNYQEAAFKRYELLSTRPSQALFRTQQQSYQGASKKSLSWITISDSPKADGDLHGYGKREEA